MKVSDCLAVTQNELELKSVYVPMSDGIRIAVDEWHFDVDTHISRPAVMITTRYWRSYRFSRKSPENQNSFLFASYLWDRGYILVVADSRGTGASFGCREMELPKREVIDLKETIEWIAKQSWCNGQVATTGTSYMANTAIMSCATSPKALKVAVARAMDFDVYRQLMVPGGILNTWMADIWGNMTGAMDCNDADTVFVGQSEEIAPLILGVRPTDEDYDRLLLDEAVAEHKDNFNTMEVREFLEFIDDSRRGHPTVGMESFAIYNHKVEIEKNAPPIVYFAGWYDAGTSAGAMSFFSSFSNPKRVIVGPWNHNGVFRADPFHADSGTNPQAIAPEKVLARLVGSLDAFLKLGVEPLELGQLVYYTLGENKWKSTSCWPLPETEVKKLYFSENHSLNFNPTINLDGSDRYRVNPDAGTGQNNRWHTQLDGGPVFHRDRKTEDQKLLVYDSKPLQSDIEITGHPVVHLKLRSNAFDGQIFVYLEAILPNGQVKMVTEGQIRLLHRKVSCEEPPYKMFGPYHSFKRADVLPLVPQELAEVSFDLLPISVRFEANWKIRVAISGADKDVFEPIVGCESPEITVERNTRNQSFIELPTIPC